MLPVASSFTVLLLAMCIVASPLEVRDTPITLPIARKLNIQDGAASLLQYDRIRATALRSRPHGGNTSLTSAGYVYYASVGVGSPAIQYHLVIDTGSSNTWVGAGKVYVKTKTSVNTGEPVFVSYSSGSVFSGTEYTDTITLGSNFTITKQSIGVANTSVGFAGFDGVLGLGPVNLTAGTLVHEPTETIPTVTQNLLSEKQISKAIFSIFFEPTDFLEDTNGELTFGGIDSHKHIGEIGYVPLTTAQPASFYWGIDGSITYGNKTILIETAGIVDTGSTFISIASDAFNAYKSATSATVDPAILMLSISPSQYNDLQDLNFKIGSNTYALTPNGQIWPRSLNTYISGSSGAIYLIVTDMGEPSKRGLDFICGFTFLERFYVVYDTTESQIGFAKTKYTDATTN